MNKITKAITVLFMLTSIVMTAQNFKSASDYLDFIAVEQEAVTKNMWKYTKAVAHSKNDRTINAKRNVLSKTIEKAIAKIERADGFDGDAYKNHVLIYMRLNESLLKQDYAKIIDLKAVAEQSYDYMEAYVLAQELADKKMEEAYSEYNQHFRAYAAKHDINILEGETDLGKNMRISNEVFNHYNNLHLKHFKVSISEVYLLNAIEKGDVSAIQQNANALNTSAKKGLEIMNTIELYKKDRSLIEATKKAFQFYIEESEIKIPVITQFLVMNEDFETIKTTLDKTEERNRTKKMVDSYNKKVKDINKAVNVYNKTNESLNNERQKVIDNLNKVNEDFLSKHIPND